MIVITNYGKLPDDMLNELQNEEKELYIQVGYELYRVNKFKKDNKRLHLKGGV